MTKSRNLRFSIQRFCRRRREASRTFSCPVHPCLQGAVLCVWTSCFVRLNGMATRVGYTSRSASTARRDSTGTADYVYWRETGSRFLGRLHLGFAYSKWFKSIYEHSDDKGNDP